MKTLFAIVVGLLALSTARGASPSPRPAKPARDPMTFMVMIASPREEQEAAALVNSLRTFGGRYRLAPVILVLADPAKADGRSLAADVQATVRLQMSDRLRRFPFADKVYACAQVEELVASRTDWLVWLNPDALVLAPPDAIAADPDAWAALRPVHVRNVGAPASAPVPEYWKRIYQAAALDPEDVWPVESLVDHQKVRAYFNSGCMAFAPDKGILRAWKAVFEKLLSDPANVAFYSADGSYSIFCHQAVLSAVVVARAGGSRVIMLPAAYGYPLGFENQPGFTNQLPSLGEAVIVLNGTRDGLRGIKVAESQRTWIAANVR